MNFRLSLLATCFLVCCAAAPRALQAAPQWVMPKIPYPHAAMLSHEQGIVRLTMTTDATGKVVKVVVAVPAKQADLPEISKECVRWILAHWSGPPNTTAKTQLEFRLG